MVAGLYDDATGRIRLHLVAIEPVTEADIEHTGHDRVDSVLRVSVWHQLHAGRNFYPYYIRAGLGGLTDNNGKADRWWKCWEWLPVDIFR